ncbi:MAG: hypothetical protein ABI268_09925 [Rhodanobacter sp.]
MSNEITSEQIRAMADSISRSPSSYQRDKAADMLRVIAAEREQSPCSLNEALAVIEQWELQGYTLQGDDGDRLHALSDKIAPREKAPAVVKDAVIDVAVAAWKAANPSSEMDRLIAAIEAGAPLLQSPAVDHAAMVAKLRELAEWCHDDLCGDVAYKINAILDAEPAEPVKA